MQAAPQAFLNVPYDNGFDDLYLAYIAGLIALGLDPRTALEIPGGTRRLDRIFELMTSCQYSIHDLSCVELNLEPPPTPRFSMPFELGLVLGWLETRKETRHTWFVFEAVTRRLSKSLSDLDGTDPYIHNGKPRGIFRELGNAFVRSDNQPTVQQMKSIFQDLKKASPTIVKNSGAKSLFETQVFRKLVVVARRYSEHMISPA